MWSKPSPDPLRDSVQSLAEIMSNLKIGIQHDFRELDTVLTVSTTFLVSVALLTAEKRGQEGCRFVGAGGPPVDTELNRNSVQSSGRD